MQNTSLAKNWSKSSGRSSFAIIEESGLRPSGDEMLFCSEMSSDGTLSCMTWCCCFAASNDRSVFANSNNRSSIAGDIAEHSEGTLSLLQQQQNRLLRHLSRHPLKQSLTLFVRVSMQVILQEHQDCVYLYVLQHQFHQQDVRENDERTFCSSFGSGFPKIHSLHNGLRFPGN